MRRRTLIWLTIGLIVGSVILAVVGLYLLDPGKADTEVHIRLVLFTIIALWFITSAILFLIELRDFAPRAKQSYYAICASAVTMGLSVIGLPLASYLPEIWNTIFFVISTSLFSAAGIVLMYIGIRRLALLIGLPRRTLSWVPLGVLSLLGVIVVALAPHPTGTQYATSGGAIAFDILHSLRLIEVIVSVYAVVLVMRLRPYVNKGYGRAFFWLAVFCGLDFVRVLQIEATQLFWTPVGLVSFSILLVALLYPLSLLRAGYVFNRTSLYRPEADKGQPVSMVDIVVYAASLVTRAKDIDPILDNMRQVTSRLKPGETLSPADEALLKQVYVSIEDYLLQKEPVLKFVQATLRDRIQLRFGLMDDFWATLPTHR